mmetsp:Transcript_772/g.1007  ORF Transcript_772/g.1007 Transcript_772/m.1007 type:complete len:105 (+) Transcript_772:278-592(+)
MPNANPLDRDAVSQFGTDVIDGKQRHQHNYQWQWQCSGMVNGSSNNNYNSHNSIPPSPQPWIESISSTLAELKSPLAQTMSLALLQTGIMIRHLRHQLQQQQQK